MLKEQFLNTDKFSNNSSNTFIFLLRKGFYPYENMCDWEKFNKTSLPKKKYFYSQLPLGDIIDTDYRHGKRVTIKNLQ